MPSAEPCNPCCSTPVVTNVPGPQGATGTGGTNGTNGVNAFTTTTSSFVVPAVNSTVSIPVVTTAFMAVGQLLYITDGTTKGIFKVTTITDGTNVVLTYITDPFNTQSGNTVASNSPVTAGGANGSFPTLLPIGNGGTGSSTKATAQVALGLGQSSTISSVSGLTQAITATPSQVGSISAVAPAAGKYLITGFFSVDWNGVTFSASRVITGKVRNVTQGADYGVASVDTQILTTTTLPTSHYVIPPQVVTLAQNDNIQIFASISVINSAGTLTTTQATVALTPLALT